MFRTHTGHRGLLACRATLASFAVLARLGVALGLAAATLWSPARAQTVELADAPLLTLKTAPGLVMLTIGRDHTLYYAAYNDSSDLDGDGTLDLYFKPTLRYEGYFANDRCYAYGNDLFTPTSIGATCKGAFSGNWLNWATMTRMDVLRKVLYGGKRYTDELKTTVLERAYVPADSHVWGKEYESPKRDGYDIALYTPFSIPEAGKRHLFANLTVRPDDPYETNLSAPLFLTRLNDPRRVAEWVVRDRPIGGYLMGETEVADRRTVRVATCVDIGGQLEDNCDSYPRNGTPTSFKPKGALQRYGEGGRLAFGLLTGSYDKNYSGGVVRRNIANFADEVDPATGIFIKGPIGDAKEVGVVQNLDRLRAWGFGITPHEGPDVWDCGFALDRQRTEGECSMWGNPLGEMMYEGLRYFSGAIGPSGEYVGGVGAERTLRGTTYKLKSGDTGLNLGLPSWKNPYAKYPYCSKPVQLVIGNPKTSFDSDQLPGSKWESGTNPALNGLNVSVEANEIWAAEKLGTRQVFIGEAGGVADGTPSVKTASSFADIRGHAPDDTTNKGSFYGASVARFGKRTGFTNNEAAKAGPLKVDQVSVAFNTPVPRIELPVNGQVVTVVPLIKAISGNGLSPDKGSWQPTGQITGFYVERLANTTNRNRDASVNGERPFFEFRVSFTDADQGSDNETDTAVRYRVQLEANGQVTVGMERFVNGLCCGVVQHAGYVISGTTADGVYLDIESRSLLPNPPDVGYFLDTAPNKLPGTGGAAPTLPESTINTPRSFTPGASTGGSYIPHDMLWYAAKYGAAKYNAAGSATFKLKADGDPQNYFNAANPSRLVDALGSAFKQAGDQGAATAAAVSANGTRVTGDSLIYQALFETARWSGDLAAVKFNIDGTFAKQPTWEMSKRLPLPAQRNFVLGNGGQNKTAITGATAFTALTEAQQSAFKNAAIYNWVLGDRTAEQQNGGKLRDRNSPIGDIVNSDPVYAGLNDFGYTEESYRTYRLEANPKLVGVGSNDGMYHLVDADTGDERMAFIPFGVRSKLVELAQPDYIHTWTVDGPAGFGHVQINGQWRSVLAGSLGAGGKGVFALDLSALPAKQNPSGTEAAAAVLWELNGDDNLGQTLSRPLVGRLEDRTSVVIVSNGPNSKIGRAALLVINATTGKVERACQPEDDANFTGNGLNGPTPVSTAGNGLISFIYATDLRGNVWRFDPNRNDCGGNGGVRIFSAVSAVSAGQQLQPMNGEIALVQAPNNKSGYMLLFGTGSYVRPDDPTDTSEQSLYGIYDNPAVTIEPAKRGDLVVQSIKSTSVDVTKNERTTTSIADLEDKRPWYSIDGKRGWLLDLKCAGCAPGERSVAQPAVLSRNGQTRVFFLSYVPGTDPCVVSSFGYVNSFDPATGAYVKGFAQVTENSLRVNGVAPRGLQLLDNSANSSTLTSFLQVGFSLPSSSSQQINRPGQTNGDTRNLSQDAQPGVPGGAQVGDNPPPDGVAGTGNFDVSPPPQRNARQVWRQLQ